MNRVRIGAAGVCLALVAAFGTPAAADANADRNAIGDAIKAQVRDIVAGINTHDPTRATMHDAPNIVTIDSGGPNNVGAAADLATFKQTFAAVAGWHVSLVEEIVDVPASGDMAVYRGTYNEDSTHDNVPFTHRVNFISGWSRSDNGSWMMDWYVVSPTEKSHKK